MKETSISCRGEEVKDNHFWVNKGRKQISLANYIMKNIHGCKDNYRVNMRTPYDFRKDKIIRVMKIDLIGVNYSKSKKCFDVRYARGKRVGYYNTLVEAGIAYNKYLDIHNIDSERNSLEKLGLSLEEYNRIYNKIKVIDKHNAQQGRNYVRHNNTSKYVGVSRNTTKYKNGDTKDSWISTITVKGKKYTLKRFSYNSEGELMAAKLYDDVAKYFFGSKARINGIGSEYICIELQDVIERIKGGK